MRTLLSVRVILIEQKFLDCKHESSSVGARQSSAAPIEQMPSQLHGFFLALLFDAASRGLPRSDRRASVFTIKDLLFERM